MTDTGFQAELQKAHGSLMDLFVTSKELIHQIKHDHEKLSICNGYEDFLKEAPEAFLARAGEKLNKKGYKLAFAGTFSGGKSTLINSVLTDPGLLPSSAGVCTLSVTIVSAPTTRGECVEIKYMTRESALKNIFSSSRYDKFLGPHKDEVKGSFNDDKALGYLKKAITDMKADHEHKTKAKEIEDFLAAVEGLGNKLGSTQFDGLHNAKKYLTTDEENRGLGHLMCIDRVQIYKNNQLFVTRGLEVVDLPGTDSINERDKEITYGFMREADVVVLVLEPRGFAAEHLNIVAELAKHNSAVKNKIFFVINRFDLLGAADLQRDQIEKLIQKDIRGTIINKDLNPNRLYLTSALHEDLQRRQKLGTITVMEEEQLHQMNAASSTKLRGLDPELMLDVARIVKPCFENGGVTFLREELMNYLDRDVQVERLNDVLLDLARVNDALHRLLTPEKSKVQHLLMDTVARGAKVHEFLQDKLVNLFTEKIRDVEAVLRGAVDFFAGHIKETVSNEVQNLIKRFNFNKVKEQVSVQIPVNIKTAAINALKPMVGQKVIDTVMQKLPTEIIKKIGADLGQTKIVQAMAHFSKELEVDFSGRYDRMLEGLHSVINLVTMLRITEESWDLEASAPMQPNPAEGMVWNENIERDFRAGLGTYFGQRIDKYVAKFCSVIARYYKMLTSDVIGKFEKLVEDLEKDIERIKLWNVKLPTGLAHDDDPEKLKLQKLADYITAFGGVNERVTKTQNAIRSLQTQ